MTISPWETVVSCLDVEGVSMGGVGTNTHVHVRYSNNVEYNTKYRKQESNANRRGSEFSSKRNDWKRTSDSTKATIC